MNCYDVRRGDVNHTSHIIHPSPLRGFLLNMHGVKINDHLTGMPRARIHAASGITATEFGVESVRCFFDS